MNSGKAGTNAWLGGGAALWALLAAALYGLSMPFAKSLLAGVPPFWMAALLYLGAGVGMLALTGISRLAGAKRAEARLERGDLPTVILMIVLDVAAPALLMLGLNRATAANASLLGNFEIVTTALVARAVFGESIGARQWAAIGLIGGAAALLSFEDVTALRFSLGSLFILLACLCWGFENNCTRRLSLKDPAQIVVVKGLGSGAGALVVALIAGQALPLAADILPAMALGFVSYGLSIFFYVKAQRSLGAARTGALYAVAPFIGAALALPVLGEHLTWVLLAAAALMAGGVWLSIAEKHRHAHAHAALSHVHSHTHADGHHGHVHGEIVNGAHSHEHVHEVQTHEHEHRPDMHHGHGH